MRNKLCNGLLGRLFWDRDASPLLRRGRRERLCAEMSWICLSDAQRSEIAVQSQDFHDIWHLRNRYLDGLDL